MLLLFAGGVALAQQAVQFGSHQIVPEQNLKKLRTERVRGAAVPTLQQLDPTFAASRNFALLQFEAIPTALQREERGRASRLHGGRSLFCSCTK